MQGTLGIRKGCASLGGGRPKKRCRRSLCPYASGGQQTSHQECENHLSEFRRLHKLLLSRTFLGYQTILRDAKRVRGASTECRSEVMLPKWRCSPGKPSHHLFKLMLRYLLGQNERECQDKLF